MSINKILLISVFMFSCVFSLRAGYHYVPYMNGGDMTRMPAYLWYAGCVPTSGCMVMGYWDNYGGMGGGSYGKNTDYGKLIQCYMDKTAMLALKGYYGETFSWSYYDADVPKAKTHYELAYHMQTNAAGGTYVNMAATALTTVAGIRGYTDSSSTYFAGNAANDWSWQNLADSIDGGKPCIWGDNFSGTGHAMAAWGYNDDKYIMVYNTWDEMRHDYYYKYYNGVTNEANTMTGVITFDPGTKGMDSDVELFLPDGGEAWLNNTPQVIHWQQYGTSIDTVKIYYSQDGGLNWTQIAAATSVQGDNYFTWTPPGTVDSPRMRVRVEGWSGGGNGMHYGDDGSRQNFYIGVNSPTVTPTVTVTFTFSVSPTVTRTFTDSPTFTATRTVTPTFTCTKTATPTATNSPTFTVTSTFTVTKTATPTRTSTLTFTGTFTFTVTMTFTVTNTGTSTYTPSSTETATETQTHTMTPTVTPTFTYTQTPTCTYTSSVTDSPTDTPTSTITPTFTCTQTPTWTYTASATDSPTDTNTDTPTGTPTFTVTSTGTATHTATITDTISPTPTDTPTFTATPQYSPTSTQTAGENTAFKINNVLVYPNPVMPGENTIYVRLDATQQPKSVRIKVYTVSFRLLKDKTWPADSITGHYAVNLPLKELGSFASGVYYYILAAEDSTGRQAKSRIGEFIVLR